MANVVLNVVDSGTVSVINNKTYPGTQIGQFVRVTGENDLRFIKTNGLLSRNLVIPGVTYVDTVTVTATTTLDDTHSYVRLNATTGNITLTLPAVTTDLTGKVLKFFRTDASSNKVAFVGTINDVSNPASDEGGPASSLYMQYGQMTIICNGTSWDAC